MGKGERKKRKENRAKAATCHTVLFRSKQHYISKNSDQFLCIWAIKNLYQKPNFHVHVISGDQICEYFDNLTTSCWFLHQFDKIERTMGLGSLCVSNFCLCPFFFLILLFFLAFIWFLYFYL